ncbi:hypothetical protein ABT174_10705 [Streptomyces sparsogenes]|uniref:hypothetical protein n=1 Tax=Streptomyces sparsogenes TaxID=67365 RepID=UPI00331D3A63
MTDRQALMGGGGPGAVAPAGETQAQFMPPLFGIALGAVILGEPVTALELLAMVPVALSTVLATRP